MVETAHTAPDDADVARSAARVLAICAEEAALSLDPVERLLANPVARDAAFTMSAMGYSPAATSIMTPHDLCSEQMILRLLARHVSIVLLAVIKDTRNLTMKARYVH